MKIMTVVGARPNFIKAAPIVAAIRRLSQPSETVNSDTAHAETIQHTLVHTGQHYGESMSDHFFADLGIGSPDVSLGVGSATHGVQTADIMRRFEPVLVQEQPDALIVVGDVNSTVACALVAAKVFFNGTGKRPLIAHVEAGLRSFDRAMPEEINRVVTDHLADLLFVTEESGLRNLRNEGVPADRIHFVGNTMIDSLLTFKEKADASAILTRLGLRPKQASTSEVPAAAPYALLTLHRPSNVDNKEAFLNILSGLEELSWHHTVVFPVHPRTQRRIEEFDLQPKFAAGGTTGTHEPTSRLRNPGFLLVEPLGYLDFLCLMKHARLVVTDSGGIQEETTCLGVPCVTVRENTERPVTVESGTNVLAGTTAERIKVAIRRQLARGSATGTVPANWDGQAAPRIVSALVDRLRKPGDNQ